MREGKGEGGDGKGRRGLGRIGNSIRRGMRRGGDGSRGEEGEGRGVDAIWRGGEGRRGMGMGMRGEEMIWKGRGGDGTLSGGEGRGGKGGEGAESRDGIWRVGR